jgi:hypothetical protein
MALCVAERRAWIVAGNELGGGIARAPHGQMILERRSQLHCEACLGRPPRRPLVASAIRVYVPKHAMDTRLQQR